MKTYLKIVLLLSVFFSNNLRSQTKFDRSFYLINIAPNDSMMHVDKLLIDSLLKIYHKTTNDTLRYSLIRNLSESLSDERWWTQYNSFLLAATGSKEDSLSIYFRGAALNNVAYEYQYLKNDISNAQKYYELSFIEYKKIKNFEGMGTAKNNLAYIFQHQGNIEKSVTYYNEAYNLFFRTNFYSGMTSALINLGDIYFNNEDYLRAEENFKKALFYCKKTKNQYLLGNVYHQLGAIYKYKKNRNKAHYYFTQAISIYRSQNNYNRLAILYISLANNYLDAHDDANATLYYTKAIDELKNVSDLSMKSRVYNFAAGFYSVKKDINTTKFYADSAYHYAKKIGYPDLIYDAATKLSEVYSAEKNYSSAFKYLKEATVMNDRINNDKIKKSILEQQFKSEFEKKEIEFKSEQEKKDTIVKAKQQKQKLMLIIVIVALIGMIVVVFIVYRSYSAKKRSALALEEKNKIIYEQKRLVEEKQNEIISSINYAQRIQSAVLTGDDVWKKISKEYFIVFQPRDIVSGDFYWAHVLSNGRAVFALADCTGHGVPGGFMSMLGNSFLNELVVENKLFKADEILNRLRDKVISALFKKGQTQQKDGMDMLLCVWNKMDNTLEFAGANNALYIVRDKQITEYKGDKMPIGSYLEENKNFTSQKIALQTNDVIYLSTDGFADQFGGEKGKKFKSKQLEDLLAEVSTLTIEEQKQKLTDSFAQWKKNFEQTDDVSLIGIKVV
jgi:serine phosphatase RsbU (regulator of sigma subunit)/TPR repeat protein